jgi:hypothetical protein
VASDEARGEPLVLTETGRAIAAATLRRTKAYAKCWTPKVYSSEEPLDFNASWLHPMGDSAWCSERRASKN